MEAETKNPLHGRPWKTAGRFDKFEKADKARKEHLEEKDLQAKVKKLKNNYVVKTRSSLVDPKRNQGKRKNKNFYKNHGAKDDS